MPIPNQLAGMQSGRNVTPRDVLRTRDGAIEIGGVMNSGTAIDGSNTGYTHIIRGGWLLGQITTTKKWVPLKRTRTKTFTSSGQSVQSPASTRIPVDNAAAFKVGDTIVVGGDSGLTITAVDYTKNHITISSAILFTANEEVYASDGSGVCKGVLLDDEVVLRDYENNSASDKPCRILVHGIVKQSLLLGDLASVLNAVPYLNTHTLFFKNILLDTTDYLFP